MSTVFERSGGFSKVRRVVADFYDGVLASPRLQPYFAGANMERLIDHQTKFVAWVMDGPVTFNDETLRRAHAGLGIGHDDFMEIAELLREAMEDNGIAPGDVDHVVRAIMRREPLIVADTGGGS
jgi:hemoglobin